MAGTMRRRPDTLPAPGVNPMGSATDPRSTWPELPLEAWIDTSATLHLWTQIVGKVRLELSPPVNHWWHVTLYVTSTGLTTSPIPGAHGTFQIDFDFIEHELWIRRSDGVREGFALVPMSVAEFHRLLMDRLDRLDSRPEIYMYPCEVAEPIRFDRDETHRSYDAEYVNRFWRVLEQSARVMGEFRGRFVGKCSPVHYFWGAPDLAVTRFSGRRAPEHPGGVPGLPDEVTREAYSHEVSSCGFWPGSGSIDYPAYYSYAYPAPPGFAEADPGPTEAFYDTDFREFILPYDAVRTSPDPDRMLLHFFQSTYVAAADLGGWDRAVER